MRWEVQTILPNGDEIRATYADRRKAHTRYHNQLRTQPKGTEVAMHDLLEGETVKWKRS